MSHFEADPGEHVDETVVVPAGQSDPLVDHITIMTERLPTVRLELNAPAPADISSLPAGVVGDGTWLRFHTSRAAAMIWVPTNATSAFLLHWIESVEKGHGSEVMKAIGQWADQHQLTGSLTCMRPMIAWYERFGWEIVRPYYFDGFIMARQYITEELRP